MKNMARKYRAHTHGNADGADLQLQFSPPFLIKILMAG